MLKSDGLGVRGTTREIGFERAQLGAVTATSKLVGRQPSETSPLGGCAGGPMDAVRWSNGLTLFFQDGDFRGWRQDGPGPTTATGLAVGASYATAAGQTSFAAAGVQGSLSPTGTITALRAGNTCRS